MIQMIVEDVPMENLILFLMFPKQGLTIWVRGVFSFVFYIYGSQILQVWSAVYAVCLIEKSSISSNFVEERPFWSKQRCGDLSICCDCRWCIECQSEYPLNTRHLSFPAGCLFRAESVPNILPKSYRKGKKNNAALQTFLPVVVGTLVVGNPWNQVDLIYHESDGSGLYTSLTNIKASWNCQHGMTSRT